MSSDKTEPLKYEGKKLLSGLVPFQTFLSQFEDLVKLKQMNMKVMELLMLMILEN